MEQETKEEEDEHDDNIDGPEDKKKEEKPKGDPDRGNEATPGPDTGHLTSREGRATGLSP